MLASGVEFLKCRQNPLYFIYNYVLIPEIGGEVKYTPDKMNLKLKRVCKVVYNYHNCILMASRQLGKALHVDTKILMYNGSYKRMADIQFGDVVIDENDEPVTVIDVSDIEFRPTYKLIFDKNNQEIICDENHNWCFNNFILTTSYIYDNNLLKKLNILKTPDGSKLIDIIKLNTNYPVKCIQVYSRTGLYKCSESNIVTHNSTLSAALIEWANNFYPDNRTIILNATKTFALENLEKVKFIHNRLPSFLRVPLKYKGGKKTYMEYEHGSLIRTFFSTSTMSPDNVARSLTSPILYIDEAAFIRHIREMYASAQPTLSKAKLQAQKNNYPYFILITTTPNGISGDGEWFFNMWSNAVDDDEILDGDKFVPNAEEYINDVNKNGFVKVKYHWSEDETKDENWYIQQKREMNFDIRKINQELDLLFVGSSTCIFDDDFLGKLSPKKPVKNIYLKYNNKLKMYIDTFDPYDFYLIGIDTAKSITGDYCAVELWSYKSFKQIGEFFSKVGSISKFCEICEEIVEYIFNQVGNRILLCIENNSIGAAVVEHFEQTKYSDLIYTSDKSKQPGINTNRSNKEIMISCFYEFVIESPSNICSSELISQLNVIEKKANSSIACKSGYHDDLFMASVLCSFVRKQTFLEITPLLDINSKIIDSQIDNLIIDAVHDIAPHKSNQLVNKGLIISREEDESDTFIKEQPSDNDDDYPIYDIFV
jgi:hypothetical protein